VGFFDPAGLGTNAESDLMRPPPAGHRPPSNELDSFDRRLLRLQAGENGSPNLVSASTVLNPEGNSRVTLSSVDPATTAPPNHASKLFRPILLRRGASSAQSPSAPFGAFAREGSLIGLRTGFKPHGAAWSTEPHGAVWSANFDRLI
jgi:hypothetical protein